ncbi:MAG TPA: OsmC family peroxiredoxin [Oceanobacillus sp.]|nr:OsmC family peroxiredoxin [Oceanobacillus sp.]
MPARTAEATWSGSLQEGNGNIKLGSGAYDGPFSFASRFESGSGTNPEEMIGAALAGCFTMQLSANLSRAGFNVERSHTNATVHLERGESGFSISKIELVNETSAPGVDEATFKEHVVKAEGCIIARALAGVGEITVDAKLV